MLLDNKNNRNVGDELRSNISVDSRLSVLSSLFSIYGYASLTKELNRLVGSRLLLSEWDDCHLQSLVGSEATLRLINKLDQKRIARECAKWISGKVEVKALVSEGKVNQSLFHIENAGQPSFAVQGSSDFTATGLGEVESDCPS
ncbi:hypothetical protein MNBD_GAMMA26-363 [hydrothermal vent metagenome]|uniref:Uncharacterized protein n=1 Tax=hydrothermal vent metagenome TaxID=652676 RepID=A0A3B1BCY1_9ZZZZ